MRIEKHSNTRKSITDKLKEEKLKEALAKPNNKPGYIVPPKKPAKPPAKQSYPHTPIPIKPQPKPQPQIQKKIIPIEAKEPQTVGYKILPTPEWFQNNKPVDISIIVPLYKSHVVIKEQIEHWDLNNDGLTKEIIYVNDFCPFNSYNVVLDTWESKKNSLKSPVGKIILNTKNGGYASACNIGANHALGKYLIFLNADCVVTTNWVKPLYDLIESNKEIGLVGNMQIKKNGYLDSAGSQWSWKNKTFEHVGRNIYNGKPLNGPFNSHAIPKDLLVPQQREMVTGCCFIIEKKLFETINGFDTNYKIGYWEDSDINMKVQELGYKVFFQPNSIIYHKVGHSAAGGHKFMTENRKLFHNRWVNSGRFEDFIITPRPGGKLETNIKKNVNGDVIGCIIACNEEEFLEASVDSIAPLVNKWIIVIGGNEYAYKAGMCDSKGYPNDNTIEIANKLASKYGGEVIEPPGRLWKDKVEMRNSYASKLQEGQWMFMLDGDEVYNQNQLWRVTELMQQYEVIIENFHIFWNNVNTIGTGSWDNYPQERIVKWHKNFGYRGKNHLKVSLNDTTLADSTFPTYKGKEKLFYHYSWVRPIDKIRQKFDYYRYQTGKNLPNYVDDVFLKWRTNPTSVKGRTHPLGGGDYASFTGIHPTQVQKLINEGKLNF